MFKPMHDLQGQGAHGGTGSTFALLLAELDNCTLEVCPPLQAAGCPLDMSQKRY